MLGERLRVARLAKRLAHCLRGDAVAAEAGRDHVGAVRDDYLGLPDAEGEHHLPQKACGRLAAVQLVPAAQHLITAAADRMGRERELPEHFGRRTAGLAPGRREAVALGAAGRGGACGIGSDHAHCRRQIPLLPAKQGGGIERYAGGARVDEQHGRPFAAAPLDLPILAAVVRGDDDAEFAHGPAGALI